MGNQKFTAEFREEAVRQVHERGWHLCGQLSVAAGGQNRTRGAWSWTVARAAPTLLQRIRTNWWCSRMIYIYIHSGKLAASRLGWASAFC